MSDLVGRAAAVSGTVHGPDRLAELEAAFEHNTAERTGILREVFDGGLWRGRYHSYEDWLERRWGLDLGYVRDLLSTRLPPRLRQRTLWELPAPAGEDGVDVEALLARAEAAGPDAVAALARERAEALERELDESEAADRREENVRRFNRALARQRAVVREALWFGATWDELEGLVRRITDLICEKAGPLIGVPPEEAAARLLPGRRRDGETPRP